MSPKPSTYLGEQSLSQPIAKRGQETLAQAQGQSHQRLRGKRVAMVVFSQYPSDPRPRRAAEALIDEGATVDYICEHSNGANAHESFGMLHITRIPVEHYRGGIASYAYQYSAFIFLSSLILTWRSLRQRYDLVYVHNMPDVLVISGMLPRLMGAKVILDQHDPMPELLMTIFGATEKSRAVRLLCMLEKWSLKRADRVVTVNEACKKLFSSRGCPDHKIRVVMNSPDEKLFTYRAAGSYAPLTSTAPFVIMYHGSLVERNGLELAVAALVQIRTRIPNVELWVYGRETPYLEHVLSEAEKLRVRDLVHYRGARKPDQMAAEIEQCTVGVIPNQRNAFTDINTPTRIFEYLALGKPVVAPNTRGILEYFSSDELFYFAPGDVDEMAEALCQVAGDLEGATMSAEKGQQIYLRHTWQNERESLVQTVLELIGDPAQFPFELLGLSNRS